MALEGIGSKIMIHKVTDVVRDANAMQKQTELMQHSATHQTQMQAQTQTQDVVDVYRPSEALIQREKEKRRRDKKKERQEETERSSHSAPDGGAAPHKRIDIRI